jgi:hypothetical protein
MHKFVHSLTMLLVLYHLLVGCCWHHAHAESPEPRVESASCTACCGHEHGNGREPAESPRPHEGGCEGGTCDFVVPQEDGGTELAHQSVPANGLCSDLPRQERVLPDLPSNAAPPPAGIPGLRLHLVNQILLI